MAVAEIRPDWTVGALTLTSGSKNFTTTGSALQTAAIQSGDEIITRSGNVLIIATITGQNSGTLMENCPAGAAGAAQPLRIRFQPDGSRYNGATADLVQRLGSGNVYALSELTGIADGVPVFTGPGTMTIAQKFTLPAGGTSGQFINGLGQLAAMNKAAVGLGNVDNTSDLNKPVSTETQTALNGKANISDLNNKYDKSGGAISGQVRIMSGSFNQIGLLQLGWSNNIARWSHVLEANAGYTIWSYDNSGGSPKQCLIIRPDGSFHVSGALSKGSGTFLIDHPLDPANKNLRHGFVEAPEYLNIYRGSAILVNGMVEINLDDYFGMTRGTFHALNADITVMSLQNQSGFSRLKPEGEIELGVLKIVCEDENSGDKIVWAVSGRRQDNFVKYLDDNCERGSGKFIPEFDKED